MCFLQALNRQLHSADVFGPWELLDALNEEEQELGLIIDLTFTTRYYDLQVHKRNICHQNHFLILLIMQLLTKLF